MICFFPFTAFRMHLWRVTSAIVTVLKRSHEFLIPLQYSLQRYVCYLDSDCVLGICHSDHLAYAKSFVDAK